MILDNWHAEYVFQEAGIKVLVEDSKKVDEAAGDDQDDQKTERDDKASATDSTPPKSKKKKKKKGKKKGKEPSDDDKSDGKKDDDDEKDKESNSPDQSINLEEERYVVTSIKQSPVLKDQYIKVFFLCSKGDLLIQVWLHREVIIEGKRHGLDTLAWKFKWQ